MREAVKEMMVKHLGFGASVGTNWMLLESDLVASIAAHAPEQEWEAKEKALREFLEDAKLHAVDCVPEEYTLRRLEQKYLKGDNYSAGQYELAEDAIAILNTPAAGGKEQP